MKARHSVLSILFLTWIVSSVDRMAMSVALPYIAGDFHLSSFQSGLLLSTFFAGYSLSQIPGGLLADIFGVRKIATAAMLWWSAFTALTGVVTSFSHMLVARFVFGLGEGVFPACAFKTIAVWFPKRERASANAIMLASNPLGAALSPLIVVAIMAAWGWRSVFLLLLVPGLIIAVLFWRLVPDNPSASKMVSATELLEIEGDEGVVNPIAPKPSFAQVVLNPAIVGYFVVLFTFDIAFWGFTAWLPTYLVKARGFSMIQMGLTASLPFFAGTLGSVLGGWVSDRYFKRDRRIPIIATQLLSAVFLYLTFSAKSVVVMVACQTAAGFFLMTFFAVFWALPMNTIPKDAMGVASGLINMAGQIAAFISPLLLGIIVQATGGDFALSFLTLIVALAVSAAAVMTIKNTKDASTGGAVRSEA